MNYLNRLEGFQLPLFRGIDPYYLGNVQRGSVLDLNDTERVLGGAETLKAREQNAICEEIRDSAHGWIEFRQIKRLRKSGDVWECKQAWLHWEEAGGKKRSRYIPKGKYADVEALVYGQRAPLAETLKLLEKKR